MKVVKRILKISFSLVLILSLAYYLGPQPESFELSKSIAPINTDIHKLDNYITSKEAGITNLKDDNQARMVWANESLKTKTEYSVVYLHGFSASQGEGFPIHKDFARRYGFNLYLARLDGHGTAGDEAMKGLTSELLVNSAKEAIAIGELVGDKVIVMSTSTGCTLALYLAGGKNNIHSLIMYSPNIKINDKAARLLTGPWGRQIGELALGGDVVDWGAESGNDSLYWNTSYSIDGLIAMQDLIDQTMQKLTFRTVKQPVFMGYYYKNDKEKDQTVSVRAMLKMFDELGTPESKKVKVAFPNVGMHVIASSYKSKDLESVRKATYKFAEEVLNIQPVN